MGHAHPIDLRQNVFRQIGLEIEMHHLRVPRETVEPREVTAKTCFGVRTPDCAADVFADQRVFLIWLEVADLIEITTALVACGATEKILAGHPMRQQWPDERCYLPARRRGPPIECRNSGM